MIVFYCWALGMVLCAGVLGRFLDGAADSFIGWVFWTLGATIVVGAPTAGAFALVLWLVREIGRAW